MQTANHVGRFSLVFVAVWVFDQTAARFSRASHSRVRHG